MYGFLDESGTPGVSNNTNDFLLVSLVLFADKDTADSCSAAISRLRNRLKVPDHYEFHYSHNALRFKNAFVKLMPNLDFQFITIAIRKDTTHKLASYSRIAELLVPEMARHSKDINVLMDSNPVLCAKLKKVAKSQELYDIRFKQAKSHSEDLIQLADYVVALCSKKLKNTEKALDRFRPIAKKQLAFIEISA